MENKITTKRPKLTDKEIFFKDTRQMTINLFIENENFTGFYEPITRLEYIPGKESPYTRKERITHFREGMKTMGQCFIDRITDYSHLLLYMIEEETDPRVDQINSEILDFTKEIRQSLIAQRDPENPEWGLPDNRFTIEHVKNIGRNILEKLNNFEKTI